jgi:hypothetical protein
MLAADPGARSLARAWLTPWATASAREAERPIQTVARTIHLKLVDANRGTNVEFIVLASGK